MDFQGTGKPLTAQGLAEAANVIGVHPPELWAVLGVETIGVGFLRDRRPRILFERHVFSGKTGGRFDTRHPDISNVTPGGYGRAGDAQYVRLAQAAALDRAAALESASWGIGQVMGFNARSLGYGSAETMVAAMVEGEDAQVLAMARFIASRPACRQALIAHDWATFAKWYNGPGYKRNRYDARLAELYRRYSQGNLPDLTIRAAQLCLSYHGHNPGPIDGLRGPSTRSALLRFQSQKGLAKSGELDGKTLECLLA